MNTNRTIRNSRPGRPRSVHCPFVWRIDILPLLFGTLSQTLRAWPNYLSPQDCVYHVKTTPDARATQSEIGQEHYCSLMIVQRWLEWSYSSLINDSTTVIRMKLFFFNDSATVIGMKHSFRVRQTSITVNKIYKKRKLKLNVHLWMLSLICFNQLHNATYIIRLR